MNNVQSPTHPRLHIRDAHDAHVVLEAVRRGILPPVRYRLNEYERSLNIRSGAVFVWEESDDENGMKRWTDGRQFSQSRMREPFLFYDEKLPAEFFEADDQYPGYRFIDGSGHGVTTPAVAHYDRSSHHPKGLVKQAYSAKVTLNGPEKKTRKWHLTAYFTYEDLETIPTIDQDLVLRRLVVPAGIFRNGKARSKDTGMVALRARSHSSDTSSSASASPPESTYITLAAAKSRMPPTQVPSRPIERAVALPPLRATIARASPGLAYQNVAMVRPAEDQRMIHILNSKHLG